MLARLLRVLSPLENTPDIDGLVTMLGRAYGLRDDFQNLSSDEVNLPSDRCTPSQKLTPRSIPKPKAFAKISTKGNTPSL
jgi:hypothetical protein